MITSSPDKEYIIKMRRELHKIPEVGFDLPKTTALIRRELDSLGIEYSTEFGKSSIVAYIGRGKGHTVALRADIDALPIKEQSGVEFSSEHEGFMHACGHDAHAAMLLGTAKMLKECEDEIPCEVRLFFQAAEETPPGGAVLMCEDGCMDGVEVVLGVHVSPMGAPGKIIFNYGLTNACSRRFTIKLYGKVAHAATPTLGIDAIAMAHRVYSALQVLRAREMDPKVPVILSIGMISGGTAANNLCDEVEMKGTLRTYDDKVGEHIIERIREICDNISRDMGGCAEVITPPYYHAVVNDPEVTRHLKESAVKVLGEKLVYDGLEPSLGGEDFSQYLLRAPGVFFRIGTRVEGVKCSTHNANLVLNEDMLVNPPLVYKQFINDHIARIN